MTKILKRALLVMVMIICGLALIGCQMGGGGGSNQGGNGGGNGGSSTGDKTVAKLDASKQGTYYGDDVVVEITESKVKITDPTGKVQEFTIYAEGDKFFIEEEGEKVYCTFGDGTVTNKHGTFSKNGGNGGGQTGNDTPAKIDASLQGEYFLGNVKVTVGASKVTVTDAYGTHEYNLYQENGQIYFYDEGEKVYCTFGNGTVTNKYGTFTRDNTSMSTVSADEAARKFAGFLEFNEQFRVPSGDAIADMNSTEDGATTYVITVVNPSETYEAYKQYFDGLFSKLGYTEAQTSWVKMESTTKGKGAGVSSDAQTKTLAIVATKFDLGGGDSTDMSVSDFANLFKEKTSIELKFPADVQGINSIVNNEDNGYINLAGSFAYGDPNDSENAFNQMVQAFDQSITDKGFTKGNVDKQQYSNVLSYSVQWINDSYSIVTLELLAYSGMNEFSILYSGDVNGGGNGSGSQTVYSWPSNQIAEFYSNKVTIPDYSGTFDSISASRINQDGSQVLQVLIDGAMEKDYKLWIDALKGAGFITNEETWFVKYLENSYVAEVYAYLSPEGFASITFNLTLREVTPWPTNLIEQKLGQAVLNAIPVPDNSGNTSYSANYASGMLAISVDSGLQTDLYEKYAAALVQAGFIDLGNDDFEYVFENYDVIELTLYRPSNAQNRFSISIEFEEYDGMEYIIPTNFHATINGFTLTKIGESYVYLYNYSGQLDMIQVFLYDATNGMWMHAEGNVYKYATDDSRRVIWQNYGTEDAPAYYQYVARPQVDNFLDGTSGLAYYYYKEVQEATNATKDASKNATIAGVACEYVTYTNTVAGAGYSYKSPTAVWIDPVSHMVYKVVASLDMNGQTTSNVAFEIKSMDLTVTSFAEVGIANCILPTYDAAHASDNDHAYGEVVTVAATCGKDGEKYQICSACGAKHVIETTKATGEHTAYMDGNDIVYTTDYEGHHYKVCTTCHQQFDEEDCTFGEWTIDRAATCSHEGTRSHKCTKCFNTVRETIPADPNAHLFLREYFNDAVVVLPTKEAAGSITWKCIEDCGATYTITLPILNADNYARIIFKDYDDNWEEQNYELFVIMMDDLIAEMKANLNPSFTIDDYYVLQYVFDYQLNNNGDYDNPLYGFKGDQVADAIASVPKAIQGEYYNENNLKVNVGESAVTIYGEQTQIFTLYSKDEDIYFNYDGSKVYVTVNDDGSIEAGDFGLFTRRIVASIGKALQGIYVSEEEDNNTYIEVYEDHVKVITGGGNDLEYTLYEDGDYYFIIMNDEKVSVYPSEENVYVDNIGFFVRPNQGGEGGEEGEDEFDPYDFPFDAVAEYLGTEEFVFLTWSNAEYATDAENFEGCFAVILTLPEEDNPEEVLNTLISYIDDYGEYGYIDAERGYGLSLGLLEDKVLFIYSRAE